MTPTEVRTRSIGFYSRGCLAGAKALPVDGESWRVMRLSRNRFWGHPAMIAFLERFSHKAAAAGVWPGILVGDISQPRGGPMLTGHASHQIGLDADIWLTPMPEHPLSAADREEMSAVDMVRPDGLSVDPDALVGAAGRRHPRGRGGGRGRAHLRQCGDQEGLCERHAGEPWMNKVRPYWGHNYHFHVRIVCPPGETACQPQEPVPPGDGCDKSLAWWFTDEALHPEWIPTPSRNRRSRWRRCRRNAGRSSWRSDAPIVDGLAEAVLSAISNRASR